MKKKIKNVKRAILASLSFVVGFMTIPICAIAWPFVLSYVAWKVTGDDSDDGNGDDKDDE